MRDVESPRVHSRRRTASVALGSAVLVLALAACGGGSTSGGSSIKGVLWQWNGLLENQPKALSAVPDPQNYLLTLNDDGSFNAKADCNNLSGTYSLKGSDLTFKLGPMTMAHCGDDSLSDKYVVLLGKVANYALQEGQLTLGLADDSGSMFFDAG